jgi:hypothetical protein
MSYTADNVDLFIASALCEQIYRRDPREQAVDLVGSREGFSSFYSDGIELKSVASAGPNFEIVDKYYYNNKTGFVGAIVEANGKIFVVYRGTDLSSEFTDALSTFMSGSLGNAPPGLIRCHVTQ